MILAVIVPMGNISPALAGMKTISLWGTSSIGGGPSRVAISGDKKLFNSQKSCELVWQSVNRCT